MREVLQSAGGIAVSTCGLRCSLRCTHDAVYTPHCHQLRRLMQRVQDGRVLYAVCTTRHNTLQHTATHCNTLHNAAQYCNTLQHTATHCNAPQHTTRTAHALCTCYNTMSIRHKTLSTCHNTTHRNLPLPPLQLLPLHQ